MYISYLSAGVVALVLFCVDIISNQGIWAVITKAEVIMSTENVLNAASHGR